MRAGKSGLSEEARNIVVSDRPGRLLRGNAVLVLEVSSRAGSKQQLYHLAAPLRLKDRAPQWRIAVPVLRIDTGGILQQERGDRRLIGASREMKPRLFIFIAGIHVGAVSQEFRNDRVVALHG